MAYIGKSPTGTGVRSRYYYTATGGETSLSGADDNSNTLVFSDGNYVDVSLNGIALVAGTDYNTSTANTIGGLSALSASDIVEVVVYDIFTVADTVSAKDGGTFSGNVAMGGTLSVTGTSTLTGATTATGGLNVGTIKEATGTNTAITIGSNGLIQPKQVAFQVEALDTDQSVSASGTTLLEFPTTNLDTGSYWDATNHRYTPQVAGWYFFSGLARCKFSTGAPAGNSVLSFHLRKNGSSSVANSILLQHQTTSDIITNGNYPFPTGMFQLNGSTDYVEIRASGEEAFTFSDSTTVRSIFSGFLVHAT